MLDTNLQRSSILPSEKVFAYKMKREALKKLPGRHSKENLSPVATDLSQQRSDEIMALEVGEGKDNIRRYIRLTELQAPILDMVDSGKIALRPAVELSYLNEIEQHELSEKIFSRNFT